MKKLSSSAQNARARNLSGFSVQPATAWPMVPEKARGLNPSPEPAEAVRVPLTKFQGIRDNAFSNFEGSELT